MYFPDLAPCIGLPQDRFRSVPLAVGWLDKNHAYPRGNVPHDFLERLWAFCANPVFMTMGVHTCEFCPDAERRTQISYKDKTDAVGSGELLIFGRRGKIYQAPDMIFHYVLDHQYLPPPEFIEAILHCPLPETKQYMKKLYGFERRSLRDRLRDISRGLKRMCGLGPKKPPSLDERLSGKYVDVQSAESCAAHGWLLFQVNRKEEALHYLDKAIQQDIAYAKAYYMRGYILENLGQQAAAIRALEQAAELYAQQGPGEFYQEAKARWFRARIFVKLGNQEAAIQNFQEAAELHRKYGRAFDAERIDDEIKALKDSPSRGEDEATPAL